jgi:hypothetical protein
MPRKETTVEADDAGHTAARCRQALAAGPPGNTVYAAYWTKQLALAEKREAKEAAQRKDVFG